MKTIQIIRNGQPTKRFQVTERAGGLWAYGKPLINADGLAALGITSAAAAKIADSGKYDKLLPAILRMGDNGNGCTVVDAEEWDRLQDIPRRAAAAAAAEKLSAVVPGLDALRTSRDGEERNSDSFSRAMESEDGASCYRQPYTGPAAAEVARQYPVAAAYLRAESYSLAAHIDKVGAGKRAMARIAAGENHAQVLADMESEWSAAAQAACDRS